MYSPFQGGRYLHYWADHAKWFLSTARDSSSVYAKSMVGVGSGCVNSITAWEAGDSSEVDNYADLTVEWTCLPAYAEVCRCATYEGSGFTNTVLNTKWSLVTTDPGHALGDSRPVLVNEDGSR